MMHRIEYTSLKRAGSFSWVAHVGIVVIDIIDPEHD